jgi:hypothetical protein
VYQRLRVAAGLSPKSTAAAAGLAGTWYAVVAYRDDHPVGMGRDGEVVDAHHSPDTSQAVTPGPGQ